MIKVIGLLTVFIGLASCSSLSQADLEGYSKSLEKGKTILKSNIAVEKFKKYYNAPNHKAFAQSKINGAGAYSTNMTNSEFAVESALEKMSSKTIEKV